MTTIARVLLAGALLSASMPSSAQPTLDFIHVDGFERLQALRIDTVVLRDPHLFYQAAAFLPCADITAAADALIDSALNADDDSDGTLDNSIVLRFRPLHTDGRRGLGHFGSASCSAPATGTSCEADDTPSAPLPYQGQAIGTCLSPLPGTVRPYDPPVANPVGPCFASEAVDAELDFGLVLPLQDVRVGGSRRDNPTPGLANGLLAGFLTEQAAQAIPVTLPLVGTVTLSSLLPGGTGNCAAHSDKDVHNGESGWWFYLNFTADEVPYVDPGS